MTDNFPNNAAPAQRSLASGQKGVRVQKWSAGKTAFVGIALGLAVAALGALGMGLYGAYGYHKIYPGVRVGGAGVNGLTQAEGRDKIAALLASDTTPQSFNLTVGERDYTISVGPEDVGCDASATAEQAWRYGRTGGPLARLAAILTALNGGIDITPVFVVRIDGITLQAEQIARETQQDLIQSAYTFDGRTLVLDRGQAGSAISAQDLAAFLRGKLEAGDFSDAVFHVGYQEPDALDLLLIKQQVEGDFQEARLDLERDPTGQTLIPASAGVRMDLEKARAALEATRDRFVEIPIETVQPRYTTAEYEALLFRDILGETTTQFNAALKGRTTNVLLANELCNGTIIMPGEVFSYNEVVGPRTYERGFKDAIVYVGTSAEDGVGGGICQVSSTIYSACLRADLEIVERRAHSRTVTYVPLGEDATVVWGNTDYQFRNNTDFPIKLVTRNTENSITVELLGTQTVENKEVKLETTRLSHTPFETVYVVDPTLPVGTEKVSATGYSGYRTETWRVVYIDGIEVRREFENKSAYTKYNKIISHNPGNLDPIVPPATTQPQVPTQPQTPTQPATQPPAATQPPTEPPDTQTGGNADETPTHFENDPSETVPPSTVPEVTLPEATPPDAA